MDKTVPPGAAKLLEFIYKTETGESPPKCYDVIYGHNEGKLSRRLSTMTIGEVLQAGPDWSRRFGSSAVGAAQFMAGRNHTLQGLKDELRLNANQVFDGNLQDRLAYHLLLRRGYADYMAGTMSRTEFGKRLAMEWASFPVLASTKGPRKDSKGDPIVVKRGQSYYAGDGLNKSLTSPEQVEELLTAIRSGVITPPPAPTPAPRPEPDDEKPVKETAFWVGVIAAIGAALIAFSDAIKEWF